MGRQQWKQVNEDQVDRLSIKGTVVRDVGPAEVKADVRYGHHMTNPGICYVTGYSGIQCTVTLALLAPPAATVGGQAIGPPMSSGPAKMQMYQASLPPPLAWTQTSINRRELMTQKWILAAHGTHPQRKPAPLCKTWYARVIRMSNLPSKQIYRLHLLLASSILQHSWCHYISCG